MHGSTQALDVQELLRHLDWVRSLARELVRDPHTAEDVAQETYRLALERPPRDAENPRGWLGAIARHVAASFGRSRDRRSSREHASVKTEAQPSAVELVADAELARSLADAVLELDEPYRSAIVLRHLRGESIERIARLTGVQPNSVRSRLARGLELLRVKLDRSRGGRAAWVSALLPLASEAALAPAKATFALNGLAAALVAALALVGGLGAWIVTQGVEREPWSSARATLVAPEEEPSDVVASAAGAPREREAASAAPTSPRDGSGVLEFEFVEPDGAPARGIAYAVWCERRGNRIFAHGVADERGRAMCTDLPEDVFLIQTERRGATACGFRGVWIPRGGTERVTVELRRGGTVTGRVVDDQGTSLEGIEIVIPGGPAAWRTVSGLASDKNVVAAVTGADGRFRVDQLRSFPQGVWIVDGREQPEREVDAWVQARNPASPTWGNVTANTSVAEGEVQELGDLVVPRPFVLAGVVVDEHGSPREGVLVSAGPGRFFESDGASGRDVGPYRPGLAGFAPRASEALTDARGAFEVASPSLPTRPWRGRLLMLASDGTRGIETVPEAEPGARHDGIVLVLSRDDRVTLELVDKDGTLIRIVASRRAEEFVHLFGRDRFTSVFSQARLVFHFDDGTEREVSVHADPDGQLRAALGRSPVLLRSLDVHVPGCLPGRVELASGLDTARPLRVMLERRPSVRAVIEWQDGAWPDAIERLSVHACRLEELPPRHDGILLECCGLGSTRTVQRAAGSEPFELPVATREAYYLHLSGTGPEERLVAQRFGPFVAGDKIEPLALESLYEPLEQSEVRTPPRSRPDERVELRARLVDASTGAELDGTISTRRPGSRPTAPGNWSWPLGEEHRVVIEPGAWELHAHARRHRALDLGLFTFAAGDRIDLGELRLEPLPVRRGRFVTADGAACGTGGFVSCDGSSGTIDAEGRFELHGEFGAEPVNLVVSEAWEAFRARTLAQGGDVDRSPVGTACVRVVDWTQGEERVLAAPSFRDVVVRIVGLTPEHSGCTLGIVLRSEHWPERAAGFQAAEELDAGARRFRSRVSTGMWTVRPCCPLHPMAERTIEVPPGDDEFLVELRAH